MDKRIEIINGKTIIINEINLRNCNNRLVLSWNVLDRSKVMRIIFYNASRIRINMFSMPMIVQGLEIIDHSRDGWDRESVYEIHDYEDDCISFFCEHIEVH